MPKDDVSISLFCQLLASGSYWSLCSLRQRFKLSTQSCHEYHVSESSQNSLGLPLKGREEEFNSLSFEDQDGPFPIEAYKLKRMHSTGAFYTRKNTSFENKGIVYIIIAKPKSEELK